MTYEYLLWIAVTCYGMHILEEFNYNWKGWAQSALYLPVDWPAFYVTNAFAIVLGICCASVGWRLPEFSLMFPALMLINALFFHIAPTIIQRRFSPGVITACLLFLPVGTWIYWGALQDGVLTTRAIIVSLIGGAIIMAEPVLLLKSRDKRPFKQ